MHNILDCKAETANFLLWGCMGEREIHYSGTSSGGFRGTTAEQQTIGVKLEVLKEEVAFKGLEQGYGALWWEVWAVHGLQELVRSRDV